MDVNAILLERGTDAVMLALFDLLPAAKIGKVFMMIIVLISFITLVNATINTVAKMSINAKTREEEEGDPPRGIQIFWGVLMGGVALLFMLLGGLDGAKAVKMLVGVPIVFMEVIAGYGLLKIFLKKKYAEAEDLELPAVLEEARAAEAEALAAKEAKKKAKAKA